MIRAGANRAAVTAVFDAGRLPELSRLLEDKGIDAATDECILRRQIDADGRSRAYINGTPVPVQTLREVGERLVDIHGQHAHQSLLRRETQRELLDAFGAHEASVAKVALAYREWKSVRAELAHLRSIDGRDRETELELLRYQIGELENLRVKPEELPALDAEHRRLANITRIAEMCQRALLVLAEGEQSAATRVSRANKDLQILHGLDVQLAPASAMLASACANIEEANTELRHYLDGLDADPTRLIEVENRLAALHDMARKHRVDAAGLPDRLTELQARIASLESSGDRLRNLEAQEQHWLRIYLEAADDLHKRRARAAEQLANGISAKLHELGMPTGRLVINVDSTDGDAPSPTGGNQIELLVSINPGQPLRPLAKVASGGELSRISLAIQVTTSGAKGLPTLIFDEVDAGIGGAVAEAVGRRLRALGENRQVLCVTHLAQVACQGHAHLKVQKSLGKQTTTTEVEALDEPARVQEIARMLGGATISRRTLDHAQEMLERVTESQ
jgi:DNA repair protein RecN (Recombination protein N)